ncbi:MAG: glutamine amidotransferase-related protein [Hyphomicrobiaceae bacterium]
MTLEAKAMDDGLRLRDGEDRLQEAPACRRPKPILIVLHQPKSTPAQVGHILKRHGHALDVRKPRFGDPLPETLAEHDGAVVFGGPMCANDNLDYLIRETQWIEVALRENKPFLGICLGAQMLANHLGARVYRDPYARAEIGYHNVNVHAPPVDSVRWPNRVYQWHRDGFDLPAGASLLASADGPYPNQAFQFGTAVAMQFHPEITYAQVNRWSNNHLRLMLPGAQPRSQQLAEHLKSGLVVQHWLDAYLRGWVAMGVEH